MRTETRLPAAWVGRLVPLEAFVCKFPAGGEWSYLLALDGKAAWWAR